jgi:hypothetical protein
MNWLGDPDSNPWAQQLYGRQLGRVFDQRFDQRGSTKLRYNSYFNRLANICGGSHPLRQRESRWQPFRRQSPAHRGPGHATGVLL